jgi:hypothetical protein
MQCRLLGCAVEAWNEAGEPVHGEVGELVCAQPIPSMPLYFWNDQNNVRGTWPAILKCIQRAMGANLAAVMQMLFTAACGGMAIGCELARRPRAQRRRRLRDFWPQ